MVRQITPYRWPSGIEFAIAVLACEPEDLARRYGLEFESRTDDLGEYKRAAIELDDGSQCWLMRHVDDPSPGTNVFVDANADHARARELVLHALDLTEASFSWINPHTSGTASSA